MGDQHQICRSCGRKQRFEFSVTDELWYESGGGADILCIECWLERFEHRCTSQRVLTMEDFTFLGIWGDQYLKGVLHDDVPREAAEPPGAEHRSS